jgi:hypothetical protein
VSRPVAPPSGFPPPGSATLDGRRIVLAPLAEEIADRYFAEFPEDFERYGDAARAWEVHDTCHCLHWAILDAEGYASLEKEVAWLTDVLAARGFSLEKLARNLELAAAVVEERVSSGALVAGRLHAAATSVRVSSDPPA